MTKYMVFGWTEDSDSRTEPANQFLGTTSYLMDEVVAEQKDDFQQFGFSNQKQKVKTTDNILGGKERDMIVSVHYSHIGGVEAGKPFLAYMKIEDYNYDG